MNHLAEIRAILARLPEGLRADWLDTNHYELQRTAGQGDYFWLDFADEVQSMFDQGGSWCDTETGQRLGLVLDAAAAYRPHVEALLAQSERLRQAASQLHDEMVRWLNATDLPIEVLAAEDLLAAALKEAEDGG